MRLLLVELKDIVVVAIFAFAIVITTGAGAVLAEVAPQEHEVRVVIAVGAVVTVAVPSSIQRLLIIEQAAAVVACVILVAVVPAEVVVAVVVLGLVQLAVLGVAVVVVYVLVGPCWYM